MIKAVGCTDAYPGGGKLSVVDVSGKPEIHGLRNVALGYTENICAVCTDTGGVAINSDNLAFQQTIPCSYTMTPAQT